MKRTWKNSEKVIVTFAVLVITLVIVGVTYGYFTVAITGNEDATPTRVTTGLLDIDFEADEYFDNEKMLLINDADRATDAEMISFSVSNMNDSTIGANYLVYINNITITDNFKSADFKWELLKDGSVLSSGNFASIGTSNELQLTASTVALPLSATHNYVLRVWLSSTDQDQSQLLEGLFRGKVSVAAVAQ